MFGLTLSQRRIKLLANVIVQGDKELSRSFDRVEFNLEDAVDDAVRIMAFKVMNTATDDIREPSHSGNFVSRGKTAKHEISKHGDTPNTDTGRLIGSIAVDHKKGSQVARVGTNLDYGLFLETSLNRPWLEPALNKEKPFFSQNMANAMDAQIKKVRK